MEIIRNPYIATGVIALCTVIFYLANSKSFFGRTVNYFSPCTQNPANSFPCYGIYDVAVMFTSVGVGIVFLGILLFSLYQTLKA